MIDKSRPRRPAPGLTQFAPVPRHYNRHDGWTPERQRGFIEALADTGSVKAAAHAVNMTPEGAYQLRRHKDAGAFRKAWEAALALGVQQLEDIALERALHGHDVPVYSYGKIIGKRTVYNDRLLMFMLKNRAPTRFAADGRALSRRSSLNDPHDANRLSRLKKQWRKEWEEEQAAREACKAEEIRNGINQRLERMRNNWLNSLTTRTRALYEAYKAAEEEDQREGRSAWSEEAEARERAEEAQDPHAADLPAPHHDEPDNNTPPPTQTGALREIGQFVRDGDPVLGVPRKPGIW